METIVIQSKNKATSKYVKRLLNELEGIESISTLSDAAKEDIAMINAINLGRKLDYIDTEKFLKKLKRQ
jgi:hypothetical protein